MKYPGHHNYQTPLVCLPINMVKIFNDDYMHTVLLGVTKKLLKIYRKILNAVINNQNMILFILIKIIYY